MAYCRKCGARLPERARYCGNCGVSVDPPEGQAFAPGQTETGTVPTCSCFRDRVVPPAYHQPKGRLQLESMGVGRKLRLLGKCKRLYLVTLAVMLSIVLLSLCKLYRPKVVDLTLQCFFPKRGLFGEVGYIGAIVVALLLLGGLLLAAKPLFSRRTFHGSQLVMSMLLQGALILLAVRPVIRDSIYSIFVETAFTLWGWIFLFLLGSGILLELMLLYVYGRMKRIGVYPYVAN